jgi:NAD(P)-dependent dehydrogenase (short-subunit alcohol dehydrogenase family)
MGEHFNSHVEKMTHLTTTTKNGRLHGKVAIVTGAAGGIGRATALLFANEGAKVVVADILPEEGQQTVNEIVACGGRGLYIQTDVTSDTDIKTLIRKTTESYQRIDILVNNAGANIEGSILALTTDQWQRALDINLSSVYRCCRDAIPHIVQSGGGSVIIMASVQGIAGFWDSSAYAAAKGGLIALTRQLARQFASSHVRVNSVSPGVILTPIFKQTANREQMFEIVSNYVPIGHIGVPEDVAFANLFLASDESSYITGINIVTDGGMTMRGV